ncbi:MAG: hypothetical protein NT084_09885, partial [Bacteroidetes bacterium]|nr:hypothetical protein [Bacteroidota bacterium]
GLLSNFANAQDAKFFVDKATTVSTTCDCATIKSIKVTIPIPSNVSTFDNYTLYVNLSSLDVPTYISFEKKDITAKLVGKKEYSAYLLKEDGTSDFTFDDAAFSKKDLCSTPRMWGMKEMTMEASGAGYKITGYHYEDKWNEYYKKWESTKLTDYDEGVGYGSGSLTIKQTPLSDGFSDETGLITVKAANTDSCSYSISEDLQLKGALRIEDNSEDFQTTVTYAYFDDQTFSYDALKDELNKSMSGKFQVGDESPFYYLRDVMSTQKKEIPGKSSSFSKTTINGTSYETASYYQSFYFAHRSGGGYEIKAGVYATFYLTKVGKYSLVILVQTKDIIELNTSSTSFGEEPDAKEVDAKWFTSHFTESDFPKMDKIAEKWMKATTYKTN